jgi:hypothetical protein
MKCAGLAIEAVIGEPPLQILLEAAQRRRRLDANPNYPRATDGWEGPEAINRQRKFLRLLRHSRDDALSHGDELAAYLPQKFQRQVEVRRIEPTHGKSGLAKRLRRAVDLALFLHRKVEGDK